MVFLNDSDPAPAEFAYDKTHKVNSVIADQTVATQLTCIEMKNDLKELIEKLAEPAAQSNTPVDRMTNVDQYFPQLPAETAFKAFSFDERVVLSSATIYQNEKYQELFDCLEAHELKLTMELLPAEQTMFVTLHEHAQKVQRKISSNEDYQNLQAALLQMRIKRRQLEVKVEAQIRPKITAMPPHDNKEVSSSVGTSGSSSLIYPKI
ncbi:hypothetical protein PGT21_000594 [Puccinia graminis f. sp. tritici]|uniref:Uncharacterized protein n=1 Tax=Puccinia graminis f. sp. tritici TaxID=56615 RepID=A0A5B0PPN0_PUCGR|nr:hypothetical protein PGT21_000594 [Puccinia graminis f. sp. tritici]